MKRIPAVLVLAFALASGASAHPHMQLTSSMEFEFSGGECAGFWLDWEFDPMFSASTIADFDKNRDKKLDAAEIKAIHDNAFINLRNYGFFTYIRKDSKRVSPTAVERFSARQEKGILHYRFFVPLKGKDYHGEFSVSVFDTTFFCAVKYRNPPAVASDAKVRIASGENRKFPIYYNPMGAVDDATVYEKWKPGLQTAYPEEVTVAF